MKDLHVSWAYALEAKEQAKLNEITARRAPEAFKELD
jgi:hypothetical protein